MHRRPLETTQRKAQKSKSQAIRQTSSGNKNLKLTNRGQNMKTLPTSKEKKDPLLRVSISPKNNKKQSSKEQPKSPKANRKISRDSQESKQKGRKKIISYKSQETDKQEDQGLKASGIQIQVPWIDDAIDDDINMLSISNYPIENNSDFLRQTHITNELSKNKCAKEKVSKHEDLKKTNGKTIRKTTTNKIKEAQSKDSKSKTSSEKKDLLKSYRKAVDQKSHKKLQKSNTGLKVSCRPIEQSNRGALSKTKTGKKQKSSSTDTKKGNSVKKDGRPPIPIKTGKSPIPANLPKSIPKPTKSKKKDQSKKKLSTLKPAKFEQESSSDTTKTPTLQELERLREQNEKYKMFLASSAFKVDQLKKQIEEHKQIRQNERGIYNFQLNNLKKQLDANKKYLGHLYSYDDPSTNHNTFLPEQIIIETDNQSSSVRDSMNMLSKMSKQLAPDDLLSQNSSNKIRKSNESKVALQMSNPSSNDIDEESRLNKSDLTSVIQEIKEDLRREEAQLKFLSDIKKIPSLEVRLSLEESDKSQGKDNEGKLSGGNAAKTPDKFSSLSNDQGENALLLLNSVAK